VRIWFCESIDIFSILSQILIFHSSKSSSKVLAFSASIFNLSASASAFFASIFNLSASAFASAVLAFAVAFSASIFNLSASAFAVLASVFAFTDFSFSFLFIDSSIQWHNC